MSKYRCENEIQNFHFHDARLESLHFEEEALICILSFLNAAKENSQNNTGMGMCIAKATLRFENVNIIAASFNNPMQNVNGTLVRYRKPNSRHRNWVSFTGYAGG